MKVDDVNVDLSVIIVNWNTRDLLADCLASVEGSRLKVEGHQSSIFNLQSEIIVIDNASSDGSARMVREQFPQVRLIENAENVGFARANNQGMAEAAGRYVLLLNSDTIVPHGALEALIACADLHSQAGIVGAQLVFPDGSFQAGPNRFPTLVSVLLESWGLMQRLTCNPHYPSYAPSRSQATMQCDWVGGACLLARGAAIQQVGMLDEAFFMNSEDVDWCRRMKQAGWEVWYEPAAKIVHFGGASASRSSAIQRMRNYRGKALYLGKHVGRLGAWIAVANYRVSSLAKAFASSIGMAMTRRAEYRKDAASHWRVAWGKW